MEAVGFMDIAGHAGRYKDILKKYTVIACTGNMNPGITDRFFDLSVVLQKEKNSPFVRFLQDYRQDEICFLCEIFLNLDKLGS